MSVSDMAMAAGLGEWGSTGRVRFAGHTRSPVVHFRYERKEPGSMLPWPRSALQSRHAQIRTTRKATIRGGVR